MDNHEKQTFADKADKAIDHPLVIKAMEEFAGNMGFALEGLPQYGLSKIAYHAAIVARAQALNIDPDELRYSPDEAKSSLLRQAAEFVYHGIPTWLFGDRT